jgi:methionyl-tRNA synthetase
MSKSKGNIVRTETILDAFGTEVYAKQFPDSTKHEQDLFAADVLRYFLLREVPFGQDGSFSFEAMITRYNADLANGYGNLVSRTLSMIEKYCVGLIPRSELPLVLDQYFDGWRSIKHSQGHDFAFDLNRISHLAAAIDALLTMHAPWKLSKANDEASRQQLTGILYAASESIRIITALLHPVMPYATAKAWVQLGLGDIEAAARNGELKNLEWGGLKPGTKLGPLSPIFPRADKGLAQIMTDMESSNAKPTPSKLVDEKTVNTEPASANTTHPGAAPRTSALNEENPGAQVGGAAAPGPELIKTPPHAESPASAAFANASAASTTPDTPQISIDDFVKIDLRVAQILVAERIPKADKLLRLEVDLGYERRQILSGIAEWYTPEELIGRRIVVITNLAPRKMRGLESHGMLLAASAGENAKPILATFTENIPLGSRLR